ncbi:MAG: alpha-L-fucosidase [Terriglobia bacterium]
MDRRDFLTEAFRITTGTALAAGASLARGEASPIPGRLRNIFAGLGSSASHRIEKRNVAKFTFDIDALIRQGPFKPDWASLHSHQDPEWFRNAKFGIYTHWGPVTVGSSYCPGDQEWFGRQMYQPKEPAFQYSREYFGDQHKFGFKDLIPRFTGKKFNADEWADIFVRAGAKFAGPVAVHHDNFALWNSSLTRWNSVAMGPHWDVVGELERAYRKRGMRFVATFHHGYAWEYYEPAFKYDAADPQYSDLYTSPHAPGTPPTGEYLDTWLAMVYEVLTKYRPDLIYFDFGFGKVITPEYQQKLFATAYDWAARHDREIAVTQKDRMIAQHTGILDFERGREARGTAFPWLTDTALGSWFYVANAGFRSTQSTVGILADIVAKNGCMMLDIGPKIDGTLPEDGVEVLLGVGRWLNKNGEAIYGTRPWTVYGEGPTKNSGGPFSEEKEKPYTAQDIRFTTKNNTLYAILLGWPGRETVINSLPAGTKLWFGLIRAVQMLGTTDPLKWSQEPSGLRVRLPESKPGDYAYVLKIT